MKYTTDILSEIQTWCHYADVAPTYETIEYGALYNWYAATDARNICAAGWHIPTESDWDTLKTYLASSQGGKLKETGLTYWNSPNAGATNEVGFNARGVGARSGSDGTFSAIKIISRYFLPSDFGPLEFCSFSVSFADSDLTKSVADASPTGHLLLKKQGCPVRPIKDSTTLTHGQTGTMTGNDGKVYRTICIGTQEWLADNLCETKYRNGDAIPVVTDNATWAALVTGAMCYYDNDSSNA